MKQINSTFTQYEFTEEELHQSFLVSDLTLKMLYNNRAVIAEAKLRDQLDTSNHLKYIQIEAAFSGQLQAYDNLISAIEEAYITQRKLNSQGVQNV